MWEDDGIPLVQLLAALRGIEQQIFDEIILADNFLETAPPTDENSIINEQVNAQMGYDEPELRFWLVITFNSISNFPTVCSNVAKKQRLIDNYF